MNLKSRLKSAIEDTQKLFPFKKYIDKAIYFEMFAILYELRKYLNWFENKRLLDIGCGPMDKTGIFKIMGFECWAVDDLNDPWHRQNNNILKIKEYARTIGINFYHQKPDEFHIPFEVNSFDVVCSLAVIEHLHESPRGLLNSIGTFTRPGGLIVIVMPNSVNLRKRLSVLMGRTNYSPIDLFFNSVGDWRGHVREYTLRETEYICRESGFEILSSRTFENQAHQKLPPPLKQLYILLGNIIPTFRTGLLVICKKPESWEIVKPDKG
jgi:SAM-dependent methyltransferase